jgi:hypothetical protein
MLCIAREQAYITVASVNLELQDMYASVDDIKISIERLLPPDIVAAMREAEVALTLSPSSGLQPIVDISDELAERELLEEMVSYRKDITGIDNTIFISPKGKTRHGPRIKLAIEPPDSINPDSVTASIEIGSGETVAGEIPTTELRKRVQQFLKLNRDVLIDYWHYRIDTAQLQRRLKPVTDIS